jgi:type IV pilus assembly protein PilV
MSLMKANPPRSQAGMSLIEVLTALLIFSIGILGLVGLQTQAVQFSTSAEDSNRAALLANEIVSTMWVNQSATVPSADYLAWQARVADPKVDGLPNGAGLVAVAGNEATVTITWRAPNAPAGTQNRYVTQATIQ